MWCPSPLGLRDGWARLFPQGTSHPLMESLAFDLKSNQEDQRITSSSVNLPYMVMMEFQSLHGTYVDHIPWEIGFRGCYFFCLALCWTLIAPTFVILVVSPFVDLWLEGLVSLDYVESNSSLTYFYGIWHKKMDLPLQCLGRGRYDQSMFHHSLLMMQPTLTKPPQLSPEMQKMHPCWKFG